MYISLFRTMHTEWHDISLCVRLALPSCPQWTQRSMSSFVLLCINAGASHAPAEQALYPYRFIWNNREGIRSFICKPATTDARWPTPSVCHAAAQRDQGMRMRMAVGQSIGGGSEKRGGQK